MRAGILEKISKLERRLKSVDEELRELRSEVGDTDDEEPAAAAWYEKMQTRMRRKLRSGAKAEANV